MTTAQETPLARSARRPLWLSILAIFSLLLGIMSAAGWDFYRMEWWHYQLFDSRRFPLYSDSALSEGLM